MRQPTIQEQLKAARLEALPRRLDKYPKKIIRLSGSDTDTLVAAGFIQTPHTGFVATRFFPLTNDARREALVVLVKPEEEACDVDVLLGEAGLVPPDAEQAIRFASQVGLNDIHVNRTIFFPHDPPFAEGIIPAIAQWLTLVWRPEKKHSETCLYQIEGRASWPKNTYIAGIYPGWD